MRTSHALLLASVVMGSIAGFVACSSDDSSAPANSAGSGGSSGSKADSGGTGGSHPDSGMSGTGGTGRSSGKGGAGGASQDAGADQDAAADADAGSNPEADAEAGSNPEADAEAGSTPDADAEAGPACIGSDAALDDADIAAGMNLVISLHCGNCHQTEPVDAGLSLEGKVVPDASIFPKNLTPDPATGLGCWTDPQIVNAIMNSVDEKDAAMCVMPKFAAKLDGSTASAEQIVAFLRSLPPVHNVVPETVCPTPVEAGTDAAPDTSVTDAADAGADGD